MDPDLVAVIEDYARTHGLNLPPHVITPDALVAGTSNFEQLLKILGMAANFGDPVDNEAAQKGQAEREAGLTGAETKFPANEEESAAQLARLAEDPMADLAGAGAQDPMSAMSGLLQSAAGIGQGLPSAFSGALQPLSQLGQQLPQAAQQFLQTGMGALQNGAGGATLAGEELPEALLDGGLGAGGLAGAAGGAGLAGTVPASELGPPPTPSARTVPASSSMPPPSPVGGESAGGPRGGGMAGMPMMPPGAMGAAGMSGDAKADTKRVVSPSVKNGAPVQGRVTTPPTPPAVTKHVQGKPVSARRLLPPGQEPDDDAAGPAR